MDFGFRLENFPKASRFPQLAVIIFSRNKSSRSLNGRTPDAAWNEARIWDEGPSGQVRNGDCRSLTQNQGYRALRVCHPSYSCARTHTGQYHSFHPTTTPSQHPHVASTLSSSSSQRAWLGGLSQAGSTQESELIRQAEHSADLAGNICRV